MTTLMEETRNSLLGELADHINEQAKNHGVDEDLSEQLSVNIVDFICEHFSGQTISFPKDMQFRRAKRNQQIYDDYQRGMRWPDLVRKYNMADRTIRRIVERMERRLKNKMQPDMFGDAG
ncbi:MAG: Mor transcription activator family protein [Providencia rettgeri]|nr:Mor transcription activator family protein [Providencia rettgeri]